MIHTHNAYNPTDCLIKTRNSLVKYLKTFKFIGLTIDDRFSYNDHMSLLIKNLSKMKGLLAKLSSLLSAAIKPFLSTDSSTMYDIRYISVGGEGDVVMPLILVEWRE